MIQSVLHGVNGAVVQKPVGEPNQEPIDVQAVTIKSKHATSFHRVQDQVNKHNIHVSVKRKHTVVRQRLMHF